MTSYPESPGGDASERPVFEVEEVKVEDEEDGDEDSQQDPAFSPCLDRAVRSSGVTGGSPGGELRALAGGRVKKVYECE
eukprot:superscaffoldBa00014849_g26458